MSNTVIKFPSNYIRARKQSTLYKKSNQATTKTGVSQGGLLSPTLFNIHIRHPNTTKQQNKTYNICRWHHNSLYSHEHKYSQTASALIPARHIQLDQTKKANLKPLKNTNNAINSTPSRALNKTEINYKQYSTSHGKNIKILGLTFDPRHTFAKHMQNTTHKASEEHHKILKSLTTTHRGKSKETILSTYTAINRTKLEYRSTIWSPILSDTNTNILQTA